MMATISGKHRLWFEFHKGPGLGIPRLLLTHCHQCNGQTTAREAELRGNIS